MIKANELVFTECPCKAADTVFRHEAEYRDDSNNYYIVFNGALFVAGCIDKMLDLGRFNTLGQAKAACQAHYSEMAKSMVDMGHKNCTWLRSFDGHFNISCVNETGERANGSFKKCARYPETKWDFKFCPYCGGEIEIKNLEQERKG